MRSKNTCICERQHSSHYQQVTVFNMGYGLGCEGIFVHVETQVIYTKYKVHLY